MIMRRPPMRRPLPTKLGEEAAGMVKTLRHAAPRRVRNTVVDFTSLYLPTDVSEVLAEAFWSHFGIGSDRSIITYWHYFKTFSCFANESRALETLADLNSSLLVRYVEWLNAQHKSDGQPWSKSARASTYGALRTLMQWLERCKPGVIESIAYPFNPFPWRNRDTRARTKLPAHELRQILRACEKEIAQLRATRETASKQRLAESSQSGSLGWLLEQFELRYGGVVPSHIEMARAGGHPVRSALARHGGLKQVEPCLYPRAETLLPYYLAILIHAAGNPDPIAELNRDCLQSLPLLVDQQALVWFKARANSVQRRTFSTLSDLEPPALVTDILKWNERLRPIASADVQKRLFLYKGRRGVSALTTSTVKVMVRAFCKRHQLPRFALASIRPSVLASFYRATGDLRRVSSLASHAHLSTTVRYVQTPQVEAQHRSRIALLQDAFVGHITRPNPKKPVKVTARCSDEPAAQQGGPLVSMFGFGCHDPYAGVAPGTRLGQLCTNFMGCFTCPNAVITSDPATLAKLVQARDHLRHAATLLHPARWQAIYASQLRILEEDILTRFSASEIDAAQALCPQLSPLPELR